MSSVSGCTLSVTKPAAENLIRQKRLRWMSGCQAGGQDGPGGRKPQGIPVADEGGSG